MNAVRWLVVIEAVALVSGFSWILLSLSGAQVRPGFIGFDGSPSGRGADCVSHMAIPNQKAGWSWKLKDCPAAGTPSAGTCGSLGSWSRYCILFPLPARSE